MTSPGFATPSFCLQRVTKAPLHHCKGPLQELVVKSIKVLKYDGPLKLHKILIFHKVLWVLLTKFVSFQSEVLVAESNYCSVSPKSSRSSDSLGHSLLMMSAFGTLWIHELYLTPPNQQPHIMHTHGKI